MIIILLFLYSFSGQTIIDALDFKESKPIICTFRGNGMDAKNPATPITNPDAIPKECEVIYYIHCEFSPTFTCNESLKAVVDLKRPTLLIVFHDFKGWHSALGCDDNAEETKSIIDYAKANGAIGVILEGLSPDDTDSDKPDATIPTNIIPYIKQLKADPAFIVGVLLAPFSILLTDPCVFNYETSNDVLDFYIINTYEMNVPCVASSSNMKTPTLLTDDLYTIEDVVNILKGTKIATDKIYLVIDLEAADPNNEEFSSYSEVCTTHKNTSNWCIPTTQDYFDKAAFIKKQNFGINVCAVELDDSLNCCECGAFIGFQNIVAGYSCGTVKPCPKFDVKGSPAPPVPPTSP